MANFPTGPKEDRAPPTGQPLPPEAAIMPGPDIHADPWRPDLEVGNEVVDIDIDCARLGRQLKHSARKIVGVLPASRKTDVRPVVYHLALALTKLCRSTIMIVDPHLTWPTTDTDPDEVANAMIATDAPAFFSARFIERSLALISPYERALPGARVELLKIILQHVDHAPTPFANVLCDLTCFQRIGEFLAVMDLLDGVILTGRSGATKEDDLMKFSALIPEELNLGVLLV